MTDVYEFDGCELDNCPFRCPVQWIDFTDMERYKYVWEFCPDYTNCSYCDKLRSKIEHDLYVDGVSAACDLSDQDGTSPKN